MVYRYSASAIQKGLTRPGFVILVWKSYNSFMNAKHELKILKNGLRVLLVPMPQVKSVTSLLLVKTGSRNEEEQKAGISHFLEHMAFKGTKKYPTALKLASTVDGVGAEFNAFTDNA